MSGQRLGRAPSFPHLVDFLENARDLLHGLPKETLCETSTDGAEGVCLTWPQIVAEAGNGKQPSAHILGHSDGALDCVSHASTHFARPESKILEAAGPAQAT